MKILLLSLLLISGCAGRSHLVVHPVNSQDLIPVDKGTQIGDVITSQEGWYLSDFYFSEILRVRVKDR